MAIKDRFRNIPLPEIIEDAVPEEEPQEAVIDSQSVFADLVKSLSQKIASIPVWFEYTKNEQYDLISSYVSAKLKDFGVEFSRKEKEKFITMFMNSVFGFGALDVLILSEDITVIFVSSDGKVEVERSGRIELSDIKLDNAQFEKIKDAMLKLSAEDAEKGIINVKLENLLITLLLPPVCSAKIIIRKLARKKVDFEYLINSKMLSSEAADLIKSYISEKHNILVAGKLNSGKSSLISAMLYEPGEVRSVLVQKFPLITGLPPSVEIFLTGTLDDTGFENLMTSVSLMEPSFIFTDLNSVKYTDYIINSFSDLHGFVTSLRADSVAAAVAKISASVMFSEKCTEKAAKAALAKIFDFIVFVDDCKLKSISALSLNKAGSLVLTAIEVPEPVSLQPEGLAEPVLQKPEALPVKNSGSFLARYQ